MPACFFCLSSSSGTLCKKATKVEAAFPENFVFVCIVSVELIEQDRIEALWSNGKIGRAENNTFCEDWYGGVVRRVTRKDDHVFYAIAWDDNTVSQGVHCEGNLWRTAHGG